MSQFDGKQIKDGSIKPEKFDLSTASSGNHPASRQYVDDQLNASIYKLDMKQSVRVASTGNVNIASPGANIDGVAMAAGNRVLLKNQTTASQNGIYVWNGAASAMTRAEDANNSTEVTPGLAVSVEEGATNGRTTWRIQNTGSITVDTTNITFELFSTTYYATPSKNNKNMTASVTTADFQEACATAIAATPAQGSFVEVQVNGLTQTLGDGVKTTDCFFSGDGGTTARAINAIAANDKLYWVGSVAGYQLAATDKISFNYNV